MLTATTRASSNRAGPDTEKGALSVRYDQISGEELISGVEVGELIRLSKRLSLHFGWPVGSPVTDLLLN